MVQTYSRGFMYNFDRRVTTLCGCYFEPPADWCSLNQVVSSHGRLVQSALKVTGMHLPQSAQ